MSHTGSGGGGCVNGNMIGVFCGGGPGTNNQQIYRTIFPNLTDTKLTKPMWFTHH